MVERLILEYARPPVPKWLDDWGGMPTIVCLTAAATLGAASVATLEREGWFAARSAALFVTAKILWSLHEQRHYERIAASCRRRRRR